MGHVPSKEVSGKPFIADLSTAKGHVDRLIAVALTKDNFTSVDDPLFQQFVSLRCDPSVLHWFNVQDPSQRTSLPKPPTPEYLYQKHVADVSEMLEKGVDPKDWSPIPMVLFRVVPKAGTLGAAHSVDHCAPGGAIACSGSKKYERTLQDIVRNGEQVQMVGYLGCRGRVGSRNGPLLSVFLDKSFWNEAKSISIFQIGCKCYEHFSQVCGMPETKWPLQLMARCLDTNLPTLRLIQKICREYNHTGVQMDHTDHRVEMRCQPATLVSICSSLASSVADDIFPGTSIHRRFRLKTQRPAVGTTPAPTPLDDIVINAKNNWNDSNAIVVAAKKEAAALAAPPLPPPMPQQFMQQMYAGGQFGPRGSGLQRYGLPSSASHSANASRPDSPHRDSPGGLSQSPIPLAGGGSTNPHSSGANTPWHPSTRKNSITGMEGSTTTSTGNQYRGAPLLSVAGDGGDAAPVPPMPILDDHPLGAILGKNTNKAVPSPPPVSQPAPIATASPPPQPSQIRLPFQAPATILIPTAQSGVLQPFPVQWVETHVALKVSSQCSQHPGVLVEVAERPSSGSIRVIGMNGMMDFALPEPCYINLSSGTPVFLQYN